MTITQFKQLGFSDQSNVLKNRAVLIGFIEVVDGIYLLLQLDSFYLEICYSILKEGGIEDVFVFDDTDFLDPYLESVNIQPVYELLNY